MKAGWIILAAAAALAGCAEGGMDPAAGPAAGATQPVAGISVRDEEDGVIRVSGGAENEDALSAHHCAAAKHARAAGVGALSWVGGVARRDRGGDEVEADLIYRMTATSPPPVRGKAPADSAGASVEDWLIYCDEAGVPREGEA